MESSRIDRFFNPRELYLDVFLRFSERGERKGAMPMCLLDSFALIALCGVLIAREAANEKIVLLIDDTMPTLNV